MRPWTETFPASPSEVQLFESLRDSDRETNLFERYNHFVRHNAEEVRRTLGVSRRLLDEPVTWVAIPADGRRRDLLYSVGHWYRYDCPELMVVSDGRTEDLQPVLARVAEGLAELPLDVEGDPRAVLQRRTDQLAGLFIETLTRAGMWTDGLQAPDPAFLADYPYGLGAWFYGHFLDDERVPLVCAAIK